jgi:ABC-type sugar transport system ATPase subunit
VPGVLLGTVADRAPPYRVQTLCEPTFPPFQPDQPERSEQFEQPVQPDQCVESVTGEDRIVSTDVGAAPVEPRSPTAGTPPPLLHLRNISKSFGAVRALNNIDLEIPAGQVTALVGDNGAGKSVLIKCISGIHTPDSGQILWIGKPVHIRSPRDAAALGIETVHQDLALCDNLDIAQNMFLGREITRRLVLAEDTMEQDAGKTLQSLAVTTVRSVRQLVASLSGGQRQAVAIAKAVLWNSMLVIMDEPTAALGVAQTEMVLHLVRSLADRGLAVILVSHNMNDVFQVADRIAVLRLGELVAQRPAAETDPQIVVDLMTTGRSSRIVDPLSDKTTRTLDDQG